MMASSTGRHRKISLLDVTLDGGGPRDTGLSHSIALAVGEGVMGETLRLHPTGEVVAFGRQDSLAPGYRLAIEAARALGCAPVERMAGGRAAAFHRGTLAFSWAIPSAEPRVGIRARFRSLADIMTDAFRSLGADAKVGEIEGEYCPGEYSVNVGGAIKVMGVGQRLIRGAAHVGGVVVVDDSARLQQILTPVYRALDVDWSPSTAGALTDAVPGIDMATARRAILDQFRRRARLIDATLPTEVTSRAVALAAAHDLEAT